MKENSLEHSQVQRNFANDNVPRSTKKLDLRPYRTHLLKNTSDHHRRNFPLSKSNSHTGKNSIALHININKNVMNTTIVRSSTKSFEKKLQNNLGSNIMSLKKQSINMVPEYSFQEYNEVLSPRSALRKYGENLTDYEKGEILDYKEIYFVSSLQKRYENSTNFSDKKKYYNIIIRDQIAYRYEILEYIGKGSFGQALKCFDHKEKRIVALKVLRCKKKLYKQGMVEANILKFIKDKDPDNKLHIIKILDCFLFRMHIMITTELLSINLYTFLGNNNFRGISLGLIKRFASQLIDADRKSVV